MAPCYKAMCAQLLNIMLTWIQDMDKYSGLLGKSTKIEGKGPAYFGSACAISLIVGLSFYTELAFRTSFLLA